MNALFLALILFSVSLNASAQILLRKAMTAGPLPPVSQVVPLAVSLGTNPWLIAGMLAYAVSIGSWMMVLSRVQVSAAYPMLSIGYVIAALIGMFFLGEAVGPIRWAGIALICCGVFVIARTA